jgi:hypothetical protein
VPAIEKLGAGKPGKLNVLVESLEEVKSEADAKGVIEKAGKSDNVDWVVWSAGELFSELSSEISRAVRMNCTSFLYSQRTAPSNIPKLTTLRRRRPRRSLPHPRHRPRRRYRLHPRQHRQPLNHKVHNRLLHRLPPQPPLLVDRRRLGVLSQRQQ